MHPILVGTYLKRIRHEVFRGGSTCLPLTFFVLYGLSPVLLIVFHKAISLQDQMLFNLAVWYWSTSEPKIFSPCASLPCHWLTPQQEKVILNSLLPTLHAEHPGVYWLSQVCIAAPVGT